MMGRAQRIDGKLFYTSFRLEDRVRGDNPLRAIKSAIDFSFVRQEVRDLYGRRGNPSVDPTVLLKLMFLLVYENVPSERALMARLPERLDWLWFCGYDLDAKVPDHSVISKARRRWGVEVFSRFFQHVLQCCIDAGLVDGRTLHADASLIHANADKSKLHPALRVVGEQLYQRLDAESEGEQPRAGKNATPPEPGTIISPTDPDARLTRKNGQTVVGYKDHRVVDDRSGIVTATVTTDAATAEAHVLSEALDQHEENTDGCPSTVVADKGYGTSAVYEEMAERQITPCIPHQSRRGGRGVGVYHTKDFHYDAGRDAYRCPAGQWLTRYATTKDGSGRYRAGGGVCARCSQRPQCTNARDSRRVTRHVRQEWIDWADGCFSGEHRRRLLSRRRIRAEGSFADAANCHGFKRARWRGLWLMTIQNLLVAAAQNVRKLMRALHRTNRPAAAAAAHPRFFTVQTCRDLCDSLAHVAFNRVRALFCCFRAPENVPALERVN